MAASDVRIISRHMIRPSPRATNTDLECATIHLNQWDLRMLSINYIQKGLLFTKPKAQSQSHVVSDLLSSFARAIDLFFPLAGRLATATHATDPPSLSVSLLCNAAGAEFVHASTAATASDILDSLYVPRLVHAFFPFNGAVSADGRDLPLLAAQVTELADGAVFVACSLNHAVADGTTFWRFFNSWSDLARTGELCRRVADPPVLDRWFPVSRPPPIRLPFTDLRDLISRPTFPPANERFFHFSAASIAGLKAKANDEIGKGGGRVSSLQALLAHVWRAVTRARCIEPREETTYAVTVGTRTRLAPPLPEAYLGNAQVSSIARAAAGELLERGLGWAAWQLNRAVAAEGEDGTIREAAEKWAERPSLSYMNRFTVTSMGISGSPRFDTYGNDFGWGRPAAARSGPANKIDGKITLYPVPEQDGGMDLEACLSPPVLTAIADDDEFMAAVTVA